MGVATAAMAIALLVLQTFYTNFYSSHLVPLVVIRYDTIDYINMRPKADE